MSERPHQRAQRVIEGFTLGLSDEQRDCLTEGQLASLQLMITEAISEELEAVAAEMEAMARSLRSQSERQERGL